MQTHCLTVIEGGNPDDQFSKSGNRNHLKFIEFTTLPSTSAESGSYPLILIVLDGTIGLAVQFLYALGTFRTRLTQPAPEETATGTDVWRGRGW